jgi:hypothetical protein
LEGQDLQEVRVKGSEVAGDQSISESLKVSKSFSHENAFFGEKIFRNLMGVGWGWGGGEVVMEHADPLPWAYTSEFTWRSC